MTLLCYCFQIDLPVQLEIETLFIILALCWLSRLGLCLVSTCVSTCFLRSFVPFHMLLDPLFCSNVLLWESPLARVAVAWRHGESRVGARAVWCWFCDVTAFTKSLIRLDSLSQPMLRRESSGPASGSSLRELESDLKKKKKKKKQELVLSTGALFWTVRFRPAHRRLFELVSVWGPAPHSFSCKAHDHSSSDI